jgi:hypothetical protein
MVEGLTSSATDQGVRADWIVDQIDEIGDLRRPIAMRDAGRSREPQSTHEILVTSAERPHPFPSRTRKLSSPAPKILRGQPFGKIGRRQDFCVFGATRAFCRSYPCGPWPRSRALVRSEPSSTVTRPRRRRPDHEQPGARRPIPTSSCAASVRTSRPMKAGDPPWRTALTAASPWRRLRRWPSGSRGGCASRPHIGRAPHTSLPRRRRTGFVVAPSGGPPSCRQPPIGSVGTRAQARPRADGR